MKGKKKDNARPAGDGSPAGGESQDRPDAEPRETDASRGAEARGQAEEPGSPSPAGAAGERGGPTEPAPGETPGADVSVQGDSGSGAGESAGGTSADHDSREVLLEQIEGARAERDALRDQAQRAQAELLNFQARMRREREQERRFRNESLLRDLMPVLDNFDRAIGSATATKETQAILDGLRLVQREIHRVLESHDVKPYESTGQPFDPATMEAVDMVPSTEVPDKQVLETLRRGYLYHERVLQVARVRIAVRPDEPPPRGPDAP